MKIRKIKKTLALRRIPWFWTISPWYNGWNTHKRIIPQAIRRNK